MDTILLQFTQGVAVLTLVVREGGRWKEMWSKRAGRGQDERGVGGQGCMRRSKRDAWNREGTQAGRWPRSKRGNTEHII
jgi:hypothetical protein